MAYGNGVSETRAYNNRLQITSIQAGAFSLVNTYGSTTNNGNIVGQTVNGASRTYGYYNLNRLTSAVNGSTWPEREPAAIALLVRSLRQSCGDGADRPTGVER